jgi:hypothetical protein
MITDGLADIIPLAALPLEVRQSMRRRTLWLSLSVLVLVVVIGTIILLRARAAPEAARLLPESEAIFYFNLKPLRMATHFGDQPITREPEYDDFVRETGFQFERDLDEMAIAVHAPEVTRNGKEVELQRRYSEIFVGHYDATRLRAFLGKMAASTEDYGDTRIFAIPHEGRTVRVALLSVDTVAVSNTSDEKSIHAMIDKRRAIASPFAGPSLLREYYRHVPFTSAAWAILNLATPTGENTALPLPGGINFSLPKGTVTVASLRYFTGIDFKVEAFTSSEDDAKKLTESANTFLTLFHSVEASAQPQGPDQDVKTFFDSLKVEQKGTRSVLTAKLPAGFLKKMMTDAPAAAPAPAEKPAPPRRSKRSKK